MRNHRSVPLFASETRRPLRATLQGPVTGCSDLPNAPKLLTVRLNGDEIPAVAQASKHGFLFVFNRETGEPLWPIEERPVPQSDIPGEETWPTQPFPTMPPPFARQSFTVDDINPFLPEEDQADLRERFETYRNEGLFTPPSFGGRSSFQVTTAAPTGAVRP